MKQIIVQFQEPKIVAISQVMSTLTEVEELIVTLNHPAWGDYIVKITKEGSTYKWYDPDAPIKTRSFYSIEDLVWEYELPKEIIPYLKKL